MIIFREKWGGQKILWPPHFQKWVGHGPLAPPLPTPLVVIGLGDDWGIG